MCLNSCERHRYTSITSMSLRCHKNNANVFENSSNPLRKKKVLYTFHYIFWMYAQCTNTNNFLLDFWNVRCNAAPTVLHTRCTVRIYTLFYWMIVKTINLFNRLRYYSVSRRHCTLSCLMYSHQKPKRLLKIAFDYILFRFFSTNKNRMDHLF